MRKGETEKRHGEAKQSVSKSSYWGGYQEFYISIHLRQTGHQPVLTIEFSIYSGM
jgi:hypothetical protein